MYDITFYCIFLAGMEEEKMSWKDEWEEVRQKMRVISNCWKSNTGQWEIQPLFHSILSQKSCFVICQGLSTRNWSWAKKLSDRPANKGLQPSFLEATKRIQMLRIFGSWMFRYLSNIIQAAKQTYKTTCPQTTLGIQAVSTFEGPVGAAKTRFSTFSGIFQSAFSEPFI